MIKKQNETEIANRANMLVPIFPQYNKAKLSEAVTQEINLGLPIQETIKRLLAEPKTE